MSDNGNIKKRRVGDGMEDSGICDNQHDTLLQDQNRAQAATNNMIRTHSREEHSNNHNILRSDIGIFWGRF